MSISLEHSILGLTDWNCRRNVQVSWASLGTRFAQNTPHSSSSSPTVRPRTPCRGRPLPPWPPAGWEFGTGCISGQNIKALMKAPLGRVQQTPCGLSSWADGRWMWVKHVAIVIVPVHPGTFTTPTLFTQHDPTFSPRTQFAWSHGTTLAGCHQTPNASTTEATCAKVSAYREPCHQMTTTQHPWADGWELSAKCAGVVSIPGHQVCSEHPTQLTFKPHCQPKGTVLWSFPGAMAPCESKLCPRLHQWAKTSGFWRHPAGESAANSLWTESLGRWPGNVGEMCGCCDDPCMPRDLHNTHTFHPTWPNFRPKDSVRMESRHHPSGVSSDT